MSMTVEEAVSIIDREYSCVDRECNIERSCGKCDLMMPSKEPILEAYKMAIEALEQQELKMGQWQRDLYGTYLCSECGGGFKEQPTLMGKPMFLWCPLCGAKMEGVKDES